MTRIEEAPAPPGPNGPNRRLTIALIVAVVVAVAAIVVAVVQTVRSRSSGSSTPSASATTSAASSTSPTSPTSSTGTTAPPFDLGYQALYPFGDRAAAQSWQSSYRTGGATAWHLDSAQTALNFTHQFLDLAGLDVITSTANDASGAHVGVGFRTPNATLSTAVVLHLVRFGPEGDAPWEVVGSDDTTFSLDRPLYGARVSSPISVGGRITGVDESITVTVRSLTSAGPLGQSCCTPAGGDNQPWSASVSYRGSANETITVVATTGGHLQSIERVAITAAISTSS